ncbi:hypothetical protein [Billgrantia gudaonensis]|uniref:Uncharacterized protein n=1 Tax=Billgrantia gudaonensis TaxID=376427 RepID=A0A1G8P8N2_9GAMM|nr:hypothetical protein [Halomonas gudaonensis]SDI88696.1 hypothetical protein SAMN04487954_1022 [Halomonas gudaonensis]
MPSLRNWLIAYDEEQHAWAVSYLERKGINPYWRSKSNYEYLLDIDKNFQENPHYKLAKNSMKAAWRQKKIREKRKGKIEFSLVISNEKKSKLRALSGKKGKTLGETLEDLIDDELSRQKEYQKKLEEEKKNLHQYLENSRGAQKTRLNEVEMTTNSLLYLLNKYVERLIQCEVDALRENHTLTHKHFGTKDYMQSRLSTETEAINRALRKIPAWKKRTFPLDIATEIKIKDILKL